MGAQLDSEGVSVDYPLGSRAVDATAHRCVSAPLLRRAGGFLYSTQSLIEFFEVALYWLLAKFKAIANNKF